MFGRQRSKAVDSVAFSKFPKTVENRFGVASTIGHVIVGDAAVGVGLQFGSRP